MSETVPDYETVRPKAEFDEFDEIAVAFLLGAPIQRERLGETVRQYVAMLLRTVVTKDRRRAASWVQASKLGYFDEADLVRTIAAIEDGSK